MKILSLLENTSLSPEYKTKHGLSLYIETLGHKILFDMGPDETFLDNAERLGIDISAVDTAVISHGHSDHGGGLAAFFKANSSAKVYVHEAAFGKYYSKASDSPAYIGLDDTLKDSGRIVLAGPLLEIAEGMVLFSGVTGREYFSGANNTLFKETEGGLMPDDFAHEQNLIIIENGMSVLFAGCAHNGIVNIQRKAEEILGRPVDIVVAGFHLYNPATKKMISEALVQEIACVLQKNNTRYHTCHCTGEDAYKMLKGILGEQISYLSTGGSLDI